MSDQWQLTERRLLQLLADRAAFGLGRREEEELRQLLQTVPYFDIDCMERAAATVPVAFAPVEPLPAAVRARIRASAARYVSTPSQE